MAEMTDTTEMTDTAEMEKQKKMFEMLRKYARVQFESVDGQLEGQRIDGVGSDATSEAWDIFIQNMYNRAKEDIEPYLTSEEYQIYLGKIAAADEKYKKTKRE